MLEQYDEHAKRRIKAIAIQIVTGMVANGEIAGSDAAIEEGIRAAMPQAIEDARLAYTAAEEFICG